MELERNHPCNYETNTRDYSRNFQWNQLHYNCHRFLKRKKKHQSFPQTFSTSFGWKMKRISGKCWSHKQWVILMKNKLQFTENGAKKVSRRDQNNTSQKKRKEKWFKNSRRWISNRNRAVQRENEEEWLRFTTAHLNSTPSHLHVLAPEVVDYSVHSFVCDMNKFV